MNFAVSPSFMIDESSPSIVTSPLRVSPDTKTLDPSSSRIATSPLVVDIEFAPLSTTPSNHTCALEVDAFISPVTDRTVTSEFVVLRLKSPDELAISISPLEVEILA